VESIDEVGGGSGQDEKSIAEGDKDSDILSPSTRELSSRGTSARSIPFFSGTVIEFQEGKGKRKK
jgi:hypothetical protein